MRMVHHTIRGLMGEGGSRLRFLGEPDRKEGNFYAMEDARAELLVSHAPLLLAADGTLDTATFCAAPPSAMHMGGFQTSAAADRCVLLLAWALDTRTKFATGVAATVLVGVLTEAVGYLRRRLAADARGHRA